MRRYLLAAGALAMTVLATAPAGAQVPPPPEQAEPVFEFVAPVANAACGNAIVVTSLGPAIVAGQLGMPLPLNPAPVFGPAVVLCGSVPVPPARLTCGPDANAAGAVNSISAAVAGLVLPLDVRVVGPVAEQVVVVEDNFPPPFDSAGLADTAITTLQCRSAEGDPPAPRDEPAPPEEEQPRSEEFEDFEEFSLPDLVLGDELSRFDEGGATDDSLADLPFETRPVVGVGPSGFAYPVVFGLPLVMLIVGGYFGRVLTQPVAPPQR